MMTRAACLRSLVILTVASCPWKDFYSHTPFCILFQHLAYFLVLSKVFAQFFILFHIFDVFVLIHLVDTNYLISWKNLTDFQSKTDLVSLNLRYEGWHRVRCSVTNHCCVLKLNYSFSFLNLIYLSVIFENIIVLQYQHVFIWIRLIRIWYIM